MKRAGIILTAVVMAVLMLSPSIASVSAETEMTEAQKKALEEQKKSEEKSRELEKKKAEEQKEAEKKKQEALQKACENRRENFKKRMESIVERSQKRIEVFDKIASRVEAFESDKNLDVENYDALLADVKAKAEKVKSVHTLAKERADDFDCDKEYGRTYVMSFKDSLSSEISAFKDYRDSLKKLIGAVREAAETQESEAKQ